MKRDRADCQQVTERTKAGARYVRVALVHNILLELEASLTEWLSHFFFCLAIGKSDQGYFTLSGHGQG